MGYVPNFKVPPDLPVISAEKRKRIELRLRRRYFINLTGDNKPAPNYSREEILNKLEK